MLTSGRFNQVTLYILSQGIGCLSFYGGCHLGSPNDLTRFIVVTVAYAHDVMFGEAASYDDKAWGAVEIV